MNCQEVNEAGITYGEIKPKEMKKRKKKKDSDDSSSSSSSIERFDE
jgi:hypothetical protein